MLLLLYLHTINILLTHTYTPPRERTLNTLLPQQLYACVHLRNNAPQTFKLNAHS